LGLGALEDITKGDVGGPNYLHLHFGVESSGSMLRSTHVVVQGIDLKIYVVVENRTRYMRWCVVCVEGRFNHTYQSNLVLLPKNREEEGK
jgi:hypothetical protein